MTSTPTFSVVMPAYNAASTIEAAIASVLAQTRSDFELVVVDDGSTDRTADIVRPFESDGRIQLLRQPNRGLPAARNAAIEASTGPFVSMLDSDDLWLPTYLEAMGEALDREPKAGLAYTDAWVLEDATRRIHRVTAMHYQDPPLPPPSDPRRFLEELVKRNFVFASATVQRSALEDVGLYRSTLAAAEDYELWLRIVAGGYRAVRVPGLLAVYRKQPGTLSTNEYRMISSEREVARIVAEEYDVPAEIREVARGRMRELDTVLTRERDALRLRYRIRAVLIRLRRVLLARWLYYRTPPAEITDAFPDLAAPPHG